MVTTYGTKLHWLHNLDGTEFELNYGPFKFEVFKNTVGVIQWMVKVEIEYIDSNCPPMFLDYGVDDFGGHETADKAKRAVETYISNVLHLNFDD